MNDIITFILQALFSGISIGIGALLFTLAMYLSNEFEQIPYDVCKLIGSIAFSIGLILVYGFKLQLYTGKIGMLYEQCSKQFAVKLLPMLVLNIIGASALGIVTHYSTNMINNITKTIANIATSRLVYNDVNDYIKTFIQGVFCGVCVHCAIRSNNILFIITFVALFVYSGHQHIIANIFYFSMYYKYDKNMLINSALVLIGNTVGPLLVFIVTRETNKDFDSSDSIDNTDTITFSSNSI